MIRVALHLDGVVQGVGFRPFVHAAATAHGLAGWVRNGRDGVRCEVEGPAERVHEFVAALRAGAPPGARVERLATRTLPPLGAQGFRIVESAADGPTVASLPADLGTCSACAAEVDTPGARRHRYPFTTCTRCGPRWTIVESVPWDRARTTMRRFPLCAACAAEYADPADRRFHAEPIACPACGPVLRLAGRDGAERARGDAALDDAADALRAGSIVALKALGGFQLLVDATDAGAVARLRARKQRPHKPFALLVASLDAARALCRVDDVEAAALGSPAAPIVLLRRAGAAVAEGVAPGNPWLGVMLPATPLHRMVATAVARPLVCTSGNLSDEPLCIDDDEACTRLGGVADLFLLHDRDIVRPVDDSVVRATPGGVTALRRARGFAPEPLTVRALRDAPCVLALGAQQKSTVALATGGRVVVSQHLGDLHHLEAARLLERTVHDLVGFHAARPAVVACDLHPDYASTRLAERLADAWGVRLERVQHHHAHVAACLAEAALDRPVLGLAWDGVGLGTDGTLWGGEALVADATSCRRVAHLRPFRLPGGERAVREPRRAALGALYAAGGDGAFDVAAGLFTDGERRALATALARGVNAPVTTAVGRLFDAVAALAGLGTQATFEGQAAMALEHAADPVGDAGAYPLPLDGGEPAVADWAPLLRAVCDDRAHGVPVAVIAARFHAALADLAVAVAGRVALPDVALVGGCFQNLRLVTGVTTALRRRGFRVHLPRAFPCNDGGISLGQALVAGRRAMEG